MSTRPDLRDLARDEDRRRRDEAKIIALQQQIDELRSIVRETTARQGRNEEQFRNYEVALAQVRAGSDQHRHEVSQAMQARHLEDARVRQQISELDGRIDETGKPIRSIQAHITEIIETLRRGKDDSDSDDRRFDELRTMIDHIAALAERNQSVIGVTRESIDTLRTDIEETRRELQIAEDSIKIVEQDGRRRFAEVNQDTKNLAVRLDDVKPTFDSLEAQIDQVRSSIVHIDPALEDLAGIDTQLQEEILRFVAQANERDDLLAERVDEIRRQFDVQVRDLRQLTEQRYERASQRVDSLVDVDRELSYRLNVLELRIEEVRELHTKLRRELWHLHELRSRMRLEQAQAELDTVGDSRRAFEQEMASERPERSDRGERSDRTERPGGIE